MDANGHETHAYCTPELRAGALALIRSKMEETHQGSDVIAKSLGVPIKTLKLAISEDNELLAAERQTRAAKVMDLVNSGRTAQQVARTLKYPKWEVDYFIERAQNADAEALKMAAMESPEFCTQAIALVKSGRTTAQVSRTLKAPKWRIDEIVKNDARSSSVLSEQISSEHDANALEPGLPPVQMTDRSTIVDAVESSEGEISLTTIRHPELVSTSRSIACPNCQCPEWKSAQFVYNEGIHSINSISSSSGVGITSGGVGMGVSATTTSGIQQSTLSQLAAPPTAPPPTPNYLGRGLFWGTVGVGLFFSGYSASSNLSMWGGAACLAYGALAIGASFEQPQDQKIYSEAMAKWRETKMCTRCGCFYV